MKDIKLTQYSHGAGCGCKISPSVLSTILKTELNPFETEHLLVGNDTRDDAAVYDMQDGTAIISTTDFFMPIVDDPFAFGKIAAANAISDIYAMGGKPLMAIAILGWPIKKLEATVAQKVMDGGRQACQEAGIPLGGGHSIDSPEPIFGLAVTGQVDIKRLKRNDTAKEGCNLLLTKPLGVGSLATAQKRKVLKNQHSQIAPESMMLLNKVGIDLSKVGGVTAMTDVTGFGLIGHLTEMCEGSKLSAEIEYDKIPRFIEAEEYIAMGCIPGGTHNNWSCYGQKVQLRNEEEKFLLCDPQTSGGLLIAVQDESMDEVIQILKRNQIHTKSFGRLYAQSEFIIRVV